MSPGGVSSATAEVLVGFGVFVGFGVRVPVGGSGVWLLVGGIGVSVGVMVAGSAPSKRTSSNNNSSPGLPAAPIVKLTFVNPVTSTVPPTSSHVPDTCGASKRTVVIEGFEETCA